jgi:hypothetical protein
VNGSKRTIIRVLDFPSARAPSTASYSDVDALDRLNREIEGRIVKYSADRRHGYDVLIEA